MEAKQGRAYATREYTKVSSMQFTVWLRLEYIGAQLNDEAGMGNEDDGTLDVRSVYVLHRD